ncbi:MAG TPA: metalloregulator ArsR/SmtB family transcription factor [Stellaceae bacterium]|jgi:ArsR family transcriptional regulator|nr:metalloregulator ArsR/SmtB family transcription factor [Stellaceae bacterium]
MISDKLDQLLTGLRAVAEPTRLRLLALCAEHDLTVTELTAILQQSQPRVSHHLKLLCDGGLLERFREGSWVFHRLARRNIVAESILAMVPRDDAQLQRDRARLDAVMEERAVQAAEYFAHNAAQWDAIRSLHVPEREVERLLLDLVAGHPVTDLLDIGTGTGRMLEIFAPHVAHATGIDMSRDMLAVARAHLERAGLRNCTIRQGDMYALPLAAGSFDLVLLHQVLHFADKPTEVLAEAARVLRPGGRLAVIDFAPHECEQLRSQHAHRRLGFADAEISQWLARAHLETGQPLRLPGQPLTVVIWQAAKPQVIPNTAATPARPLAAGIAQ